MSMRNAVLAAIILDYEIYVQLVSVYQLKVECSAFLCFGARFLRRSLLSWFRNWRPQGARLRYCLPGFCELRWIRSRTSWTLSSSPGMSCGACDGLANAPFSSAHHSYFRT